MNDLFANAALGVQSLAFETGDLEGRSPYSLEATGEDMESLMVNWINEVIYWFDAKRIGFARFETRVTEGHVLAVGWGEMRNVERHPPKLVVKAATYHLLSVKGGAGSWTGEVYLDI